METAQHNHAEMETKEASNAVIIFIKVGGSYLATYPGIVNPII